MNSFREIRSPCRRFQALACGLFSLGLAACAGTSSYVPDATTPPAPPREFRGAWVASVGNTVWPSRKDLTSAQQKAELLALLDRAAALHLNAVLLQVRPACDALYASKLEPWSEYLTGVQGRAPSPYYDPLEFAVAEAHQRGLELHAWFNPYRALDISAKGPVSTRHVSRTRPQLVRQYGKFLWLDPGERETQDYSLSVVMDVVRRYDIDGVHFDDYFYPYKVKDARGAELDFPDEASWRRYGVRSGLSRDDWRRENVNAFVRRAYQQIKAAKPWVKFGISPFGIWRPGSPASVQGLDAYAKLYADSRKWLANGWVDYFAPQLYWSIDAREQSFPALMQWWALQNPMRRHLWPGLNDMKVGSGWSGTEIANQIRLARRQTGVSGQVHWSLRSLMGSRGDLGDALAAGLYAQPALVPASPWLNARPPLKPRLTISGSVDRPRLKWSPPSGAERAWLWALQTKSSNGAWTLQVLPGGTASGVLSGPPRDLIALTAISRTGVASAPAVLRRKP